VSNAASPLYAPKTGNAKMTPVVYPSSNYDVLDELA
jgi:hypothetical protein